MNSKDKLYALFYKFIFLYEDKLKLYKTNKAAKKAISSYNDEFIRLFGALDYTKVNGGKAPRTINEKDSVYMTNNKPLWT